MLDTAGIRPSAAFDFSGAFFRRASVASTIDADIFALNVLRLVFTNKFIRASARVSPHRRFIDAFTQRRCIARSTITIAAIPPTFFTFTIRHASFGFFFRIVAILIGVVNIIRITA